MIDDIPMVTKVRPTGGRTLRVRFAGDRREYVLDLTGLIARSRHLAPLMEDADTFAKIDIVDDGIRSPGPWKRNGVEAGQDRAQGVSTLWPWTT